MNLIKLITEEIEIQEKRKSQFGLETKKIIDNARQQFVRNNKMWGGMVQFKAEDIREERKIIGFHENQKVINVPKNNKNLVELLGIKVFEGVRDNFKYPLWNNIIYQNDDFKNLPYAIYNEADTGYDKDTLSFEAKKCYINVAYSGEILRSSNSSIQNALTEDALKQFYDKALFEGLLKNVPNQTPQTATTKEDIINYLDGASGQHQGIFIIGKKAFQTILKMGDVIKNNLVFDAIPYMVYESRYLPSAALIYFNPSETYMAQFGAFDMTVDNVTDRIKDIIHVHLEGYFDCDTANPTNNILYVAEPSGDDTDPSSGDTTPQESGTTEPTESGDTTPSDSGDTPTNEGE